MKINVVHMANVKNFLKHPLFCGIAGALISFALTSIFTANSTEKGISDGIAETLSTYFDFVDEGSDYKKSLKTIYDKYSTLENDYSNILSQKNQLDSEIIALRDEKVKLEKEIILLSDSNDKAELQSTINAAKTYAETSDFKSASALLYKYKDKDSEAAALYFTYSTRRADEVILIARELIDELKHEDALHLVKDALKDIPDSSSLIEIQKELTEYLGSQKLLWKMDYYTINKSHTQEVFELKDNDGVIRKNVIGGTYNTPLSPFAASAYIHKDFKLSGQYKMLTGYIFKSFKFRDDTKMTPRIQIMCDGTTVADIRVKVGESAKPIKIDLDGVDILEVMIEDTYYGSWWYGGVSDLRVS